MSAKNCLNCNTPLQGAFCHVCGQKGSTHRLSIKHFIAHDLVHGLWHLDGSFPRTLKAALLRPGRSARAYIDGKRAGCFNLVTMLIILTGLNLVVSGWVKPELATGVRSASVTKTAGSSPVHSAGRDKVAISSMPPTNVHPLVGAIDRNVKWIIIGLVPVLSLASMVVFRRFRFNYAEHLVINAYVLIGLLVFYLFGTVLKWLLGLWISGTVQIGNILSLVFIPVAYWQAFVARYSIAGWLWRMAALLILFILFFSAAFVAIAVTYVLATGGKDFSGFIELKTE